MNTVGIMLFVMREYENWFRIKNEISKHQHDGWTESQYSIPGQDRALFLTATREIRQLM